MTKYGSPNVGAVLVDGYDLMSYLLSMGPVKKAAVLTDNTTVGKTWKDVIDTGLKEMSIGPYEGFYDDDDGATGERALAEFATAVVICELRDGNTVGKNFIGAGGSQTGGPFVAEYERMGQVGDLHKMGITFKGAGYLDDGKILHALGVEPDDGNTQGADSQDNGAGTSNGGAGYVQLTALTLDGGSDLTVKVRHSTDDSTYTDLLTFTALTAKGAERKAVSGTVNRHLAASWAYTGSEGVNATATLFVGFARY